ncbi:MAG: hypothetical protein LEGION0398_MBIBDBAK_00112 [Legionellaceae bacterium]
MLIPMPQTYTKTLSKNENVSLNKENLATVNNVITTNENNLESLFYANIEDIKNVIENIKNLLSNNEFFTKNDIANILGEVIDLNNDVIVNHQTYTNEILEENKKIKEIFSLDQFVNVPYEKNKYSQNPNYTENSSIQFFHNSNSTNNTKDNCQEPTAPFYEEASPRP